MCGRFAMNSDTNALLEQIVAEHGIGAVQDWQSHWPPNYNVAPTDQVPVARERHGQREIESVRWGMVPPSSKEFGGKPIFNARVETVGSNGMFKRPLASGRCIVPALGYYEWQQRDDGKQPYFIRDPNGPMALAGVVSAWRDRSKPDDDPDAWRLSMAIVTLDAHVTPGEVHDREPAFLTPDAYDDWLGDHLGTEELVKLLQRTSADVADGLEYYEVSRAVNRVEKSKGVPNTGPELIDPIQP